MVVDGSNSSGNEMNDCGLSVFADAAVAVEAAAAVEEDVELLLLVDSLVDSPPPWALRDCFCFFAMVYGFMKLFDIKCNLLELHNDIQI